MHLLMLWYFYFRFQFQLRLSAVCLFPRRTVFTSTLSLPLATTNQKRRLLGWLSTASCLSTAFLSSSNSTTSTPHSWRYITNYSGLCRMCYGSQRLILSVCIYGIPEPLLPINVNVTWHNYCMFIQIYTVPVVIQSLSYLITSVDGYSQYCCVITGTEALSSSLSRAALWVSNPKKWRYVHYSCLQYRGLVARSIKRVLLVIICGGFVWWNFNIP